MPSPLARLELAGAPVIRLGAGGASSQSLAPLDAALFAWLAVEGPVPRARIAALLWPDKDPDGARNLLRQRLFRLRKVLGVEVVTGGHTLALADGVTHDLAESDRVLGDLDAETFAPGEFARWLGLLRERRRSRVRSSLAELAAMAEQARDYDDALAHAKELLALEPLSEEAHRRVMRLHYLKGERAAALLAFDACERVLKDEVGARPSPETQALLALIEGAKEAAAGQALAMPTSMLRPPRLVGRARELAELHAAWHAAQVAALIGEAGMGKTRLAQEFGVAHAGTLHVAARPGDAGVPFATLARLLRAVAQRSDAAADRRPALPAASRQLIAHVLPEFDGAAGRPTGEGQRLALLRAVRLLLAAHPRDALLVVDDLHFADEASLDLLAGLVDGEDLQGDAPQPQRWLLAWRPAEAGSALALLQDRLIEQIRLATIALGPLDEAALAELVDSLALPGVSGAALAPGLLKRTGGNPLFVLETLKQAWVGRTLGEFADARALPRPQSVGRLIERRVAQLSPGALALARVASIAGVDFSIELAEYVLQATAMAFADSLNELEAAQVLRGTQFAHDLVFEAVRASVPRAIAEHTHGKVAQWLEEHAGEPARIAQHWIAARQRARARPGLEEAARRASRAARHREAAGFLATKSEIEEALGEREPAFASLAAATEELIEVHCGLEEGTALCDRAERLAANGEQQVHARLLRATLHTHLRLGEPAVAHAEQALALAESIGHERLVAYSHKVLGDACAIAGHNQRSLQHVQRALAWIDQHGDAAERSNAHGALAMQLDDCGRGAESLFHHERGLALALEAGDRQSASIACTNLFRNRVFAGRLEEAEAACLRAEQLVADYEGASSHAPMLHMGVAMLHCSAGRYEAALQRAEGALALARQQAPAVVDLALVRLAYCWWHLGQWARVKRELDAVSARGLGVQAVAFGSARMAWAYALATDPRQAPQRREALRRLVEAAPEGERPDLRLPAALALVDAAGAAEALDAIAALRNQAQAAGHVNVVLATHLREAEVALATDPRHARRAALAALELHAQGLRTTALMPGEVWLHSARALDAAGDRERAEELAAQGREWVLDTARGMPAPYRPSFMQRNPVNAQLLALAAQLVPLPG
jgi:DNA-binding SARP family transcriptional activator